MDHAGDAAYSLRRAFPLHPWNRGDETTEQIGDRKRQIFLIRTSDASTFRVTVEDITGLEIEDELYMERTDVEVFRGDLRMMRGCRCCGSTVGNNPEHSYCPRNECLLVAAGLMDRETARARLVARGVKVAAQ